MLQTRWGPTPLGLWPIVIGWLMGIPQVARSVWLNAWLGRSDLGLSLQDSSWQAPGQILATVFRTHPGRFQGRWCDTSVPLAASLCNPLFTIRHFGCCCKASGLKQENALVLSSNQTWTSMLWQEGDGHYRCMSIYWQESNVYGLQSRL